MKSILFVKLEYVNIYLCSYLSPFIFPLIDEFCAMFIHVCIFSVILESSFSNKEMV